MISIPVGKRLRKAAALLPVYEPQNDCAAAGTRRTVAPPAIDPVITGMMKPATIKTDTAATQEGELFAMEGKCGRDGVRESLEMAHTDSSVIAMQIHLCDQIVDEILLNMAS